MERGRCGVVGTRAICDRRVLSSEAMRRTVRCFAHLARRASHASRSANFVEEQPFALWALSRQRSNAAASADGVKEPSKTTASSSHRDGSGGAAQAREGSRPPQKGRDRNAGYASSGGVDKRTADFHGCVRRTGATKVSPVPRRNVHLRVPRTRLQAFSRSAASLCCASVLRALHLTPICVRP